MEQDKTPRTYVEKLRTYIALNELCEISLKSGMVHKGKITEVGLDFVTFVGTIEREIIQTSEGEDGKKEKTKTIERIEMETTLMIADIDAVTRILRTIKR